MQLDVQVNIQYTLYIVRYVNNNNNIYIYIYIYILIMNYYIILLTINYIITVD